VPGVRRRARASLLALALAAGPAGAAAQTPPTPDDAIIIRPPQATIVYDRRGGVIGAIGPENRSWVRIVDLPAYVGNAFVAVEDHRFYQHDGVDVVGVIGALRDNLLRGGRPRGASTITQQLVGAMNLVNRRELTMDRKVREARLARGLERRHTKAEILEAYLNYVLFSRHGWYGVESAARHYFGKHARDLTIAEAASLAALAKSPVLYDPRERPVAALQRRNVVLRLMRDQRYISDAQYRQALAQPQRTVANDGYSVRAPYVVELVRQWLAERFGLTAVNTAGFEVTTTIDPDLQQAAQAALLQGLARVESLPGYRWTRYGARGVVARAGRTPYLQGGIVALDPASGDVLALVGGRDFRDSEFNRMVQGRRQAGSAFKPFVYTAALEHGVTPSLILEDTPLSYALPDRTVWSPENSDGTFSGSVTARTALMRSLNVATIRLADQISIDTVIATAHRFGLSTEIPPYLPTAIGAADVRPIELVSAYGAFATLGTHVPPRFVTLVRDATATPVYEALPPAPDSVVDPRVAFQIVSMLQDAADRGTGTAARRAVGPTLPLAGKTGTTNDNADVWFIGFTPNLVAGVWIGFDRPQTITSGAFGGTLAAPIWGQFARAAYRGPLPPPTAWQPPPGLVALRVRRRDGTPVGGEGAPGVTGDSIITEYFLEGTEPTPQGIVSRVLSRLWWW
jgi:penicillin-binding protein 1A